MMFCITGDSFDEPGAAQYDTVRAAPGVYTTNSSSSSLERLPSP